MNHLRKLKLGLLLFGLSLVFSSCTLNEEELFEPTFETSVNDNHNEDADPEIEDPNGG